MRDELLSEKTKRLPLFFFNKNRWAITFHKGDAESVKRFDKFWRTSILIVYGMDVLLAAIKLYVLKSEEIDAEMRQMSGKKAMAVDYSMNSIDYVECALVLFIMYMLIIY